MGAMTLRRRPPLGLLLLVLVGLGLAIEHWIETDLEALERWEVEAAEALIQGDEAALGALLTEDFTYGRRDREAALRYARSRRQALRGLALDIRIREIEVEGDTARATAVFEGTLGRRRGVARSEVVFQRGPDGWLLESATDIER